MYTSGMCFGCVTVYRSVYLWLTLFAVTFYMNLFVRFFVGYRVTEQILSLVPNIYILYIYSITLTYYNT